MTLVTWWRLSALSCEPVNSCDYNSRLAVPGKLWLNTHNTHVLVVLSESPVSAKGSEPSQACWKLDQLCASAGTWAAHVILHTKKPAAVRKVFLTDLLSYRRTHALDIDMSVKDTLSAYSQAVQDTDPRKAIFDFCREFEALTEHPGFAISLREAEPVVHMLRSYVVHGEFEESERTLIVSLCQVLAGFFGTSPSWDLEAELERHNPVSKPHRRPTGEKEIESKF